MTTPAMDKSGAKKQQPAKQNRPQPTSHHSSHHSLQTSRTSSTPTSASKTKPKLTTSRHTTPTSTKKPHSTISRSLDVDGTKALMALEVYKKELEDTLEKQRGRFLDMLRGEWDGRMQRDIHGRRNPLGKNEKKRGASVTVGKRVNSTKQAVRPRSKVNEQEGVSGALDVDSKRNVGKEGKGKGVRGRSRVQGRKMKESEAGTHCGGGCEGKGKENVIPHMERGSERSEKKKEPVEPMEPAEEGRDVGVRRSKSGVIDSQQQITSTLDGGALSISDACAAQPTEFSFERPESPPTSTMNTEGISTGTATTRVEDVEDDQERISDHEVTVVDDTVAEQSVMEDFEAVKKDGGDIEGKQGRVDEERLSDERLGDEGPSIMAMHMTGGLRDGVECSQDLDLGDSDDEEIDEETSASPSRNLASVPDMRTTRKLARQFYDRLVRIEDISDRFLEPPVPDGKNSREVTTSTEVLDEETRLGCVRAGER
ncbi:hypothetical protein HK102_006933, partial [Quaeritorhiza haematococci]